MNGPEVGAAGIDVTGVVTARTDDPRNIRTVLGLRAGIGVLGVVAAEIDVTGIAAARTNGPGSVRTMVSLRTGIDATGIDVTRFVAARTSDPRGIRTVAGLRTGVDAAGIGVTGLVTSRADEPRTIRTMVSLRTGVDVTGIGAAGIGTIEANATGSGTSRFSTTGLAAARLNSPAINVPGLKTNGLDVTPLNVTGPRITKPHVTGPRITDPGTKELRDISTNTGTGTAVIADASSLAASGAPDTVPVPEHRGSPRGGVTQEARFQVRHVGLVRGGRVVVRLAVAAARPQRLRRPRAPRPGTHRYSGRIGVAPGIGVAERGTLTRAFADTPGHPSAFPQPCVIPANCSRAPPPAPQLVPAAPPERPASHAPPRSPELCVVQRPGTWASGG